MRRHGWQLPYHPLQVVAIAVFFALAFGFYVFFMPFVGMEHLEIFAITLYSPMAVIVFVLYVWCVAKDPADSGVLHGKQHSMSPSIIDKPGSIVGAGGQDVARQSGGQLGKDFPSSQSGSQKAASPGEENSTQDHATSQFFKIFCCNDCKCKSTAEVPVPEVETLYCSLCKAEICIHSKHCRVCDKCVDGFDHHCRWLNNCVGRKNYNGFFALLIFAIFMLLVQWSFGLRVLVHCFLNLSHFEGVIASKLGSSFSPVAYIIVVVICTVLAMTASYPLGQLLCFHVLLIKKGISTYDYIIAMREQEQKAGGESVQSPLTSPVSSLGTMNSATSSAVGIHGRAWCTPPRLFFDHEQETYPPERSLPSKDVEPGVHSKFSVEESVRKKATVKLSPWALASMNKENVLRAVISAKNKSSNLQSLGSVNEKAVVTDTDSSVDSSRDMSAEFNLPSGEKRESKNIAKFDVSCVHHHREIMSWQSGKLPQEFLEQLKGNETNASQLAKRGKRPLNPLQIEARNAFKTSESFSTHGGISGSSSVSNVNSPDVHGIRIGQPSIVQSHWPWMQRRGMYEPVESSSSSERVKGNSLPCTTTKQSLVNVSL